MKFFTAAIVAVVLTCACADVSHLGYNYQQPAPAASAPSNSYIPPAANVPDPVYAPAPVPVYQPAPVPSAPASAYIPPAPAAAEPEPVYQPAPSAPASSYIPPAPQPAASEVYEQPAEDGYRYRTVRRRVYKQRRF
uniref:DUF4794 domain-containing protein n=1 Tax=Bactrocera latifrons TaxID=174628 RepID=A0A0K8UAZ6_BACLA